MLANRRFQVHMGDKFSRWRTTSEGLLQNSVLSPVLFNLYMSDVPATQSEQFWFADDLSLAHESSSFEESKSVLTDYVNIREQYFRKWRLQPSA